MSFNSLISIKNIKVTNRFNLSTTDPSAYQSEVFSSIVNDDTFTLYDNLKFEIGLNGFSIRFKNGNTNFTRGYNILNGTNFLTFNQLYEDQRIKRIQFDKEYYSYKVDGQKYDWIFSSLKFSDKNGKQIGQLLGDPAKGLRKNYQKKKGFKSIKIFPTESITLDNSELIIGIKANLETSFIGDMQLGFRFITCKI